LESIKERRFRKKVLKEDEKKSDWRFGIPMIAFLLVLPFLISNYFLGVVIGLLIVVIIAVGLNLLMGYTGQFSLGHAAFVAIGAYSAAYAANNWGFPFLPAILFGGVVAGIMGLVVGIPALRIEGLYLAIATMGFAFIVDEFIDQLEFITGGAGGVSVDPASSFGFTFDTDQSFYYLALFFSVSMVILAKNLAESSTGRAFVAVRDSEEAAQANGISVTRTKVLAFVISAVYAGTAGGLSAFYLRFLSPENFTLGHSIEYLVMVVVGGMMSIYGSVIGVFVIGSLPHLIVLAKDTFPPIILTLLPGAPGISTWVGNILDEPSYRTLIYGLIMLFFIVYEPNGLYAIWLRFKFYWETFPFNRKKVKFKGKRMLLYRSYR